MVAFRGVMGVVCLVACAGCGPSVSVVRTVSYPPREESCSLEFLKLDMADVSSSTGTWEMIGQVVLREGGTQDPFSEEYRAIVRPRACDMGGEAVSIVMNANSQTLLSSGTAISYGVLRKRRADAAKPQQF